MKILLIGGLGYIGRGLLELLERKHEVSIIDANFYDQDGVPHTKFLFGVDELTEKVISLSSESDVILWLINPDFRQFYWTFGTEERLEMLKKIEKYLGDYKDKVINFSTYNKAQCSEEWPSRTEKQCTLNIMVPSLFGISKKMRWDTIINSMILEAVQTGSLVVKGDVFDRLPFSTVFDFCTHVVDLIENHKKIGFEPKLHASFFYSIVEIAHIIANFIELEFKVVEPIMGRKNYENDYIMIEPKDGMVTGIQEVIKILQTSDTSSLLNEKNNNASVFYAAGIGRDVIRMFERGTRWQDTEVHTLQKQKR